MEQFVIIFLIFLAGAMFGWEARERAAKKVVEKFLDQMQDEVDHQKENFIGIKIERDGDFLFVYNSDTNAFMGQATNRNELEKVLADKFPGKRFTATSDNLKEVGFK